MKAELRARLQDALGAGVAVDWEESDPAATVPRVVLSQISGGSDYGTGGPSGLARARVQIDCMGSTYGVAVNLAASVRAALSGWRGGVISAAFIDSERDLGRSAASGVALSGVAVDVMIHYQE